MNLLGAAILIALSDEERELNPDAAEATGSAVAPVRHLAPPCQIPSPAQMRPVSGSGRCGRGGDPGQMWRGDSCSTRCPDARVANAIGPGTHESEPEPSRAGAVRHVKASAQEEEPSFWIMAAVCEKLYCGIFSETLWGAAGLLPVGH